MHLGTIGKLKKRLPLKVIDDGETAFIHWRAQARIDNRQSLLTVQHVIRWRHVIRHRKPELSDIPLGAQLIRRFPK